MFFYISADLGKVYINFFSTPFCLQVKSPCGENRKKDGRTDERTSKTRSAA